MHDLLSFLNAGRRAASYLFYFWAAFFASNAVMNSFASASLNVSETGLLFCFVFSKSFIREPSFQNSSILPPVIIKVDRIERVKVPAGEFEAFVLRPTIKSKGLFGESGEAEVWLANDSTRTLLKLKSKLPVGTLYLELKGIENTSRR